MAGWTTPRTWVTGEVVTAAQLNAHVRDNFNALNGYVAKTADQSITSSATLTNDTHLLWTIGATGTYIIDVWLYGTSAANAAGNLKVGFSFPTGTLHFSLLAGTGIASGSAGSTDFLAAMSATSGTTAQGYSLSTSPMGFHVHAILTATATGTLRLMWAQNSSNANASTLKAGSHMRVQQVA